jgi:hypothetical protein
MQTTMGEKELLRKLGEETLYSAKGHFKSVDLRRVEIKIAILGAMVLGLLGAIGLNEEIDRWMSAFVVLFSFMLFYWDAEEGKDYRIKHKQTAELYLALHKEIRACFFLTSCDNEEVRGLSEKVMQLDKSAKPDIPWLARKWAQRAIENYDETNNWFLKNANIRK